MDGRLTGLTPPGSLQVALPHFSMCMAVTVEYNGSQSFQPEPQDLPLLGGTLIFAWFEVVLLDHGFIHCFFNTFCNINALNLSHVVFGTGESYSW